MAKLVFSGDQSVGRTVELGTGRTMVGRGQWNGLVIADKTVSNYHCDLVVHGTEVIVREKGSTNGTWVDGLRVTGQLPVKQGQVVRFGSVCARLIFDGSERWVDDSETDTACYELRSGKREPQAAADQTARPTARTVPVEDQTVPATYRPCPAGSRGTCQAPAWRRSPEARFGERVVSAPGPIRGLAALALIRAASWLGWSRS